MGRFNATIRDTLAKFTGAGQRDWDHYIPYALYAYRTSEHASTRETPFYLTYGREPYNPMDMIMGHKPGKRGRAEYIEDLERARAMARKHNTKMQKKYKKYYDAKREEKEYLEGDKVMLRTIPPKGKSRKMSARWGGPYRIIRRLGMNNYKLRGCDNDKDEQVTHIQRIKSYHEPENPNTEEEIEEIIDERKTETGIEYLVKWKGWTARYNEWLGEEELHNAKEEIKEFKRERQNKEEDEKKTTTKESESGTKKGMEEEQKQAEKKKQTTENRPIPTRQSARQANPAYVNTGVSRGRDTSS